MIKIELTKNQLLKTIGTIPLFSNYSNIPEIKQYLIPDIQKKKDY